MTNKLNELLKVLIVAKAGIERDYNETADTYASAMTLKSLGKLEGIEDFDFTVTGLLIQGSLQSSFIDALEHEIVKVENMLEDLEREEDFESFLADLVGVLAE